MTDLSKSPFVTKTEFYMTAAAIWLWIAVVGDLERSKYSWLAFLLTIIAAGFSILYSVLGISARRKRTASGGEST
jgi:hypothetical protein